MAIKRGSKVDKSFSAASMTDLMFLLLMFMLIATTLINPNALKVLLPQGSSQLKDKPFTTVTITPDLQYYVEEQPVSFDRLERVLQERVAGTEKPVVSLHCDETVAVREFTRVAEIITRNKWQLIMALRP